MGTMVSAGVPTGMRRRAVWDFSSAQTRRVSSAITSLSRAALVLLLISDLRRDAIGYTGTPIPPARKGKRESPWIFPVIKPQPAFAWLGASPDASLLRQTPAKNEIRRDCGEHVFDAVAADRQAREDGTIPEFGELRKCVKAEDALREIARRERTKARETESGAGQTGPGRKGEGRPVMFHHNTLDNAAGHKQSQEPAAWTAILFS